MFAKTPLFHDAGELSVVMAEYVAFVKRLAALGAPVVELPHTAKGADVWAFNASCNHAGFCLTCSARFGLGFTGEAYVIVSGLNIRVQALRALGDALVGAVVDGRLVFQAQPHRPEAPAAWLKPFIELIGRMTSNVVQEAAIRDQIIAAIAGLFKAE